MSTSENNLNYTDGYDVDEDTRTLSAHGDQWEYGNSAGITYRSMTRAPTDTLSAVASLKNKNSLSRY